MARGEQTVIEVVRDLPVAAWVLVAAALVLGWALSWLWRVYRRHRARKALIAMVTAAAADHLVDVLVPDGMDGYFQVDFLLLTPSGVVVIDLRDVSGNVFGGDQMNEWTVMDGARRSTFINPQSALYDRIAAVKALAGDVPVQGRIVFTRRARFLKGMPRWTVTLDSLSSDFPLADPAALSEAAGRFEAGWQQIKSAVTPSSLKPVRAAATG